MTLKFRKFKAKDERNMFKVTINFSDKFDDKTIHWELPAVNLNEASIEIERLAIFLEKCKNRYPNGKGGLDDFTDIPDYYRYFCRTGYYPVDTVRNGKENPTIYHFFRFVGEFPWNQNNVHPDNDVFDRYLALSPWKDYTKLPAEKGLVLKVEKVMYRLMPRSLFIIAFKLSYEYFIYRANKDSLKEKINKTM